MENKRVLIIATRLFWPTDSGKKLSLFHCCKALHDVFGYEIYMYSFLEDGQTEELLETKPDYIKDVRIAKKIKTLTKINNLIFKSVLSGKSFQNSLFYSRANKKAIKSYFNSVKPDVVIFDMLRTARYSSVVKGYKCNTILYIDDLLSKRYERQANSSNSNGNIAGKFAGALPKMADKLIKSPKRKKKLLLSESKRIAKEEKYYAKKFNRLVLCSEKETQEFNALIGQQKVVTIRQCVDYDYLSQKKTERAEDTLIGFLGNLNYAPNVASVDLIADKILPFIKSKFRFIVVGPVSEELKQQFSSCENIVFLGKVDDLREVLQQCRVFLSPIAYGSGVKTKILEAMAMGIPVVTNCLGVEGIDGENGKHFLVSDNCEEIAGYVDQLIADNDLSTAIAESARKLIYDKYRWEVTLDSYRMLDL